MPLLLFAVPTGMVYALDYLRQRRIPVPNLKKTRFQRLSKSTSLFLSVTSFLVLFTLFPPLIDFMLSTVTGQFVALIIDHPVILMFVSLFIPYLIARLLFDKLRWRWVEGDTPYCEHCSYNLTGNVSGICPECGTAIPTVSKRGSMTHATPRRLDANAPPEADRAVR